jgi:hypothetical protein
MDFVIRTPAVAEKFSEDLGKWREKEKQSMGRLKPIMSDLEKKLESFLKFHGL